MAILWNCHCGKQLQARDDAAGKRVKCPFCDKIQLAPVPTLETSDFDIQAIRTNARGEVLNQAAPPPSYPGAIQLEDGATATVSVAPLAQASDTHSHAPKQYKVLTRRDDWFSGDFHPDDLEQALNFYSGQGWCLRAAFVTRLAVESPQDEVIVILER